MEVVDTMTTSYTISISAACLSCTCSTSLFLCACVCVGVLQQRSRVGLSVNTLRKKCEGSEVASFGKKLIKQWKKLLAGAVHRPRVDRAWINVRRWPILF